MKERRKNYYAMGLMAAALVFTVSACSSPIGIPDTGSTSWETGNNHSSSQADPMQLNYSPVSDGYDHTGSISSDDSADDWSSLTTSQSGQLSITLQCLDLAASQHISITLYNSTLISLDTQTLSGSQGGSITASTSTGMPAGLYYIRVSSNTWTHNYDLTPEFTNGGAATDFWETENNNSNNQADELPLSYNPATDGYNYSGSIAANDSSDDWYRLSTTTAGQLSVSLNCTDLSANEHMFITLYDFALNELDTRTLGGAPGVTVTVSTSPGASAGTYYVSIEADSWTHQYDLTPSFIGSGGSGAYWEVESNSSSNLADALPLNYNPNTDGYDFTGVITALDTSDDWFVLTTTQSGELAITLSCMDLAGNEQLYLTLYDSSLNEVDTRVLSGSPGGSVTAYTSPFAMSGTYYARIEADSWPHNYDLAPHFTP